MANVTPCYQKRIKRRFNIASRTSTAFAQSVSLVNEGQKEQPDRSTTRDYRFRLNAYADLPGGFRLQSDAAYSFRNGTNITLGEDDQMEWNASLSWRFLRQKKAELSFYWADILSQKKNFTRSVSSTGLSETHTQQIGSWFMLSFKYRFNRQL